MKVQETLRNISKKQFIQPQDIDKLTEILEKVTYEIFKIMLPAIQFQIERQIINNWSAYKAQKQYSAAFYRFIQKLSTKSDIFSKPQFKQTHEANYYSHFFRKVYKVVGWKNKHTLQSIKPIKEKLSEKGQEWGSKYIFSSSEKMLMMPLTRLCCSTFYYQDSNILDKTMNSCPFTTIRKLSSAQGYELLIKQIVCGFLNSNGGILFFEMQSNKQGVWVRGTEISELDKQSCIQRLQKYMSQIIPKLEENKHYNLQYLPIRASYQNNKLTQQVFFQNKGGSQGTRYKTTPFIQGKYVLRLKIKAALNDKPYYFMDGNKPVFYKWKEDRNQAVTGEGIYILMSAKKKQLELSKTVNFPSFQHNCRVPEEGKFLKNA